MKPDLNSSDKTSWTFFSNHGHIYFLIANQSDITKREISSMVGISERAVSGILKDLVDDGYIKQIKLGRKNNYSVIKNKKLRHNLEDNISLSRLIEVFKV
jgi:predicted transcriptional regulator